MEHATTDPTLRLPADMFYQLIHTLRVALPVVSGSPEDVTRRDHAAIAEVASMLPANAHEAKLAAVIVAAEAESLECLRQVREHPADSAVGVKFSARSATMMR